MEQEFTFVTSHPLFPKIFRWKDQKRRVSFTHFPVGFSGNIFVNHSMVNNRYFHTTPIRHMWVEFVVGSLHCSERFFSKSSGFPSPQKTNALKFQFDLKRIDTFHRVLKNP